MSGFFSEKASCFFTFSFDLFGPPILFISRVPETSGLEGFLLDKTFNKDFLFWVALFISSPEPKAHG